MLFRARFMVRYLFGGPVPATPEFGFKRILNDEPLRQARERVQHGNWKAAREVIEEAGVDWEVRGRRISVLSDAAAADDSWLGAWLRAEPSDPTAMLVQAAMLLGRAGEARGSASAANTTAEQFQSSHALSEAAAQVGRRAMALAGPDDPLSWVAMMGTMYGDRHALANSFDEVFDEGRRRDPYNFDLHFIAISLRCQKWGGSHELMFATARAVAEAAPPGASAVLLPLFAHFEYAMREFSWDTRTGKSLEKCRKYFRRPEVRHDVDQWIAKWRSGTPGPAKISTCRQWQALYYALAGRRKEAKAVFDELGRYVTPATAWAYFWAGEEYGYLKNWWWANGV